MANHKSAKKRSVQSKVKNAINTQYLTKFRTNLNKFQNFSNSIILTFSLCATMIVQFHLNFGAYPDILSYFLLLLVFISRNEKVVPYILFFLALLVKETNIFTILFFFFVPWVVLEKNLVFY